MITLEANEKILMVIRRHWYALFRHTAFIIVLAVTPVVLFALGENDGAWPYGLQIKAAVNFFLSLYALGLLLYAFVVWADYYLDVWIVTDRRLVDIEQHGLFSRTISELPVSKIQNVTMEIPGFIATMLRFGDLKVETASQSAFIIHDAPNMYEAKEIILRLAHIQPRPADSAATPLANPPA